MSPPLAAMSFICHLWRQRCRRQRKPYNRACSPLEMHPFGCCAPLPPEGEVYFPLFLVLTYVAHFIAPLESPPPGETPPKAAEGVHFLAPQARLACFPSARQGGCKGFIILAPLLFEGRPPQPSWPQAVSNFRPLRLQACQTSAQRAVNPHAQRACP